MLLFTFTEGVEKTQSTGLVEVFFKVNISGDITKDLIYSTSTTTVKNEEDLDKLKLSNASKAFVDIYKRFIAK